MLFKVLKRLIGGLCLFLCMHSVTWAQLGIGTKTPDSSAVLDVSSTEQGLLPPRMTTTQRDAINGGTVAEGLMIYNTDEKCLQYWDGTEWLCNSKGENSGNIDVITKKTLDTSLTQVFAMDDYKSFFTAGARSEISNDFHDAVWLGADKFATLHKTLTYNGTTPYKHKATVTLYDLSFGKIKEFTVDGLDGWWSMAKMTVLKNGNLAIATGSWATSWGSSSAYCSGQQYCSKVALVTQNGDELKVEQLLFPAGNSPQLRGVWGLDNSNYIVGYHHNYGGHNRTQVKTFSFNTKGEKIREVNEGPNTTDIYQYATWSPTNYGYLVMQNNLYKSYDFEGILIDTVNFSLSDNSIMELVWSTGGKRLMREKDNMIYYISDAGFFKMNASKDSVSILSEKKQENSDSIYKTTRSRWYSDISGVVNQDKIIYLGQLDPAATRKVPIGVFPDGSPLIKSQGGYRILTYDSKLGDANIIKYITFTPGTRLKQSYYHDSVNYQADQYNFDDYEIIEANSNGFVNYSNLLKVSPDGKYMLTAIEIGADAHDLVSVFDISNLNDIKRVTHVAKSNGVKQHVGKRFVITGPETMLTEVSVSIADGYQKGDKLESYCSSEWLACSSVANFLIITASPADKKASMQHFTQALNEMTFTSNAGAGPRTIEVQATTASGKAGEVLKFTLNVSD